MCSAVFTCPFDEDLGSKAQGGVTLARISELVCKEKKLRGAIQLLISKVFHEIMVLPCTQKPEGVLLVGWHGAGGSTRLSDKARRAKSSKQVKGCLNKVINLCDQWFHAIDGVFQGLNKLRGREDLFNSPGNHRIFMLLVIVEAPRLHLRHLNLLLKAAVDGAMAALRHVLCLPAPNGHWRHLRHVDL